MAFRVLQYLSIFVVLQFTVSIGVKDLFWRVAGGNRFLETVDGGLKLMEPVAVELELKRVIK